MSTISTAKIHAQISGRRDRRFVCGLRRIGGIAVITGISPDLLVPAEPKASKLVKALNLWTKGALASGTTVERYINGRGVTIPVPPSIRYLARQRNWTDGQFYPAMNPLWSACRGTTTGMEGRCFLPASI